MEEVQNLTDKELKEKEMEKVQNLTDKELKEKRLDLITSANEISNNKSLSSEDMKNKFAEIDNQINDIDNEIQTRKKCEEYKKRFNAMKGENMKDEQTQYRAERNAKITTNETNNGILSPASNDPWSTFGGKKLRPCLSLFPDVLLPTGYKDPAIQYRAEELTKLSPTDKQYEIIQQEREGIREFENSLSRTTMRMGPTSKRAESFGFTGDHEVLIPKILQIGIISRVLDHSDLLRYTTQLHSYHIEEIPRQLTDITFKHYAEGQPAESHVPTEDSILLKAEKLSANARVSWEMSKRSGMDYVQYVVNAIVRAARATLEDAMFTPNEFDLPDAESIGFNTVVNEYVSQAEGVLTTSDIIALRRDYKATIRDKEDQKKLRLIMPSTTFYNIIATENAQGRYPWLGANQPFNTTSAPEFLFGFPVSFAPKMDITLAGGTIAAYLADMSGMFVNVPGALRLTIDHLNREDIFDINCHFMANYKIVEQNKFIKLTMNNGE